MSEGHPAPKAQIDGEGQQLSMLYAKDPSSPALLNLEMHCCGG